eukprot:gene805-4745_t
MSDSETDAASEPESPLLLGSSPPASPSPSGRMDQTAATSQFSQFSQSLFQHPHPQHPQHPQHQQSASATMMMQPTDQSQSQLQSQLQSQSQGPPRWKVTLDKTSGKRYYWHSVTREVRWDLEPHLLQQALQPPRSSQSQQFHYQPSHQQNPQRPASSAFSTATQPTTQTTTQTTTQQAASQQSTKSTSRKRHGSGRPSDKSQLSQPPHSSQSTPSQPLPAQAPPPTPTTTTATTATTTMPSSSAAGASQSMAGAGSWRNGNVQPPRAKAMIPTPGQATTKEVVPPASAAASASAAAPAAVATATSRSAPALKVLLERGVLLPGVSTVEIQLRYRKASCTVLQAGNLLGDKGRIFSSISQWANPLLQEEGLAKLRGQQCCNVDGRLTSSNSLLSELLTATPAHAAAGAARSREAAGVGAGAEGPSHDQHDPDGMVRFFGGFRGNNIPTTTTTTTTTAASTLSSSSSSSSRKQLRPWIQSAYFPNSTSTSSGYNFLPPKDDEYEEMPRGASFESWIPSDIAMAMTPGSIGTAAPAFY